jgi:hypothetical protein
MRYVAGSAWSAKRYMNMRPLYQLQIHQSEACRVMAAWGFDQKSLHVWVKVLLLIGKRGSVPRRHPESNHDKSSMRHVVATPKSLPSLLK